MRHPATKGTPQGAVISPLRANIYLHYVFDLWAEQWRRRHAQGAMIVVRYADDTVVGFEHRADAERFLAELHIRMAAYSRRGGFLLVRNTRRARKTAKLEQIGADLRRRMHQDITEQGRWLRSVVQGFFADHAVPTNIRALFAFRHYVTEP